MGKRLAALILCALALCACNLEFSTDALLSPPRLTAEQAAIYDALELAVGTNTFKLKYPRRGENHSACTLADLDRDGVDEAIVFYELTVGGVTSSWMSVLVQQNGVWKSRQEIPGAGSEIDFIDFAPIDNAQRDNIIVGWMLAGQENMTCKAYTYEQSVRESYTDEYSEVLIDDIDANGLYELVLCTRNTSRQGTMTLAKCRTGGRIVRTSVVDMPIGMTGYAQLLCGPLTTGLTAIFADITLAGGNATTQIAAVDSGRSVIEGLSDEELGVYESFERVMPTLYCADVNSDGLVDIPVARLLPGYSASGEGDRFYLTEYKSIIGGTLAVVMRAAVNFSEGYMVRFPDAWADAVTIRRQSDTGEWRFVLYNGNLNESTTELLRIKVVSPSDYQDKLETAQYRTLAQKGANSYLAYIPEGDYPGYSITDKQLEQMFSLLP